MIEPASDVQRLSNLAHLLEVVIRVGLRLIVDHDVRMDVELENDQSNEISHFGQLLLNLLLPTVNDHTALKEKGSSEARSLPSLLLVHFHEQFIVSRVLLVRIENVFRVQRFGNPLDECEIHPSLLRSAPDRLTRLTTDKTRLTSVRLR